MFDHWLRDLVKDNVLMVVNDGFGSETQSDRPFRSTLSKRTATARNVTSLPVGAFGGQLLLHPALHIHRVHRSR